MHLIYVASPYTDQDNEVVAERVRLVEEFVTQGLAMGHIAFSPVVYGHSLSKKWNLPPGFDFWRHFNLYMLSISLDMVVLCIPGWKGSVGVRTEIEYAQDSGKKVILANPQDLGPGYREFCQKFWSHYDAMDRFGYNQ